MHDIHFSWLGQFWKQVHYNKISRSLLGNPTYKKSMSTVYAVKQNFSIYKMFGPCVFIKLCTAKTKQTAITFSNIF